MTLTKESCPEFHSVEESDDQNESDELKKDQNVVNQPFCKGNCSTCMGCILVLLINYRYHCRSYNNLYKCLRVALTLPCTVVSCERVFSKVRFVKSRLRSLLGQELLEALIICSVELYLLKAIYYEAVYHKLAAISSEMTKLLLF